MKNRSALLIMSGLLVFNINSIVFAGNYDDVSCVQNISKTHCTSDGYWSGQNRAYCKAYVRLQKLDSKFKIIELNGYGSATTDTGPILAGITFGLSELIANQANALGARNDAIVHLRQQLEEVKLIPFCNGATDQSESINDHIADR